MLVLARKKGEVIKIGNDITITVLETSGDMVRLGIDAPRNVAVHRLEVFQEIERENRQASMAQPSLADLAALKMNKRTWSE